MKLREVMSLALCASLASGAELPVRAVVLYKHGVGYFERSGTLARGEAAQLDFKAAEMNDVLKSLEIVDSAGKVTGVRYDSNVPLETKLSEFPFELKEGQPLSAVLDQLKGARVELEFGAQRTAGAIVSARLIPADKEHAEREQLTLLADTGELRTVDVSAASAVRFIDPKLQLQFRDYLGALTSARSTDRRSVFIDSSDAKAREVRASYIMPMPAWKSSYRLAFDTAGTQPVLEGWAIVDNTTGEDWTNVKMSLVSGKPISFISDLYDPKYIRRQTAELPEDQSVMPVVHNGAVQSASRLQQFAKLQRSDVVGGVMGGIAGAAPMAGPVPPPPAPRQSSIEVQGNAAEIADLFEYSIAAPVTVKKNESAMLPFLQQKITGRRLIIYSDQSRPNPFSAAELTNNTGRTLDGGPLTVYEGSTYAGEALVETVKAGDHRFISYGVDLGTRISTAFESGTRYVREVHVRNGNITVHSAWVEKRTYTARNVDAREKTLIIEHPVQYGAKLVDTAKPVETSATVYRFEVKLPANGNIAFPVSEERGSDEQFTISNLSSDALLTYIRNKAVPGEAQRQIEQIAALKTRIAALDAERARIESTIQSTSRDEERNRQNISSLSAVAGQQQTVQDYAVKLSAQETQIAGLRARENEVETQRTSLQAQLNAAIAGLQF